MEKWSKYLLGTHFYVYTDHKNIEHLHTKYDDKSLTNRKLTRWFIRMQHFDCDCFYIKGAENILSDYLSRDIMMETAQHFLNKQIPNINNTHNPILKPTTNDQINVLSNDSNNNK